MRPNWNKSITRLHDLERHITRLADRPADAGPVISCHLDLTRGVAACRRYISDQASNLRSGLRGKARRDFERGLSVLLERLAPPPGPRAGGLSLFVAVRGNPEVLASLFFAVPVGDNEKPLVGELDCITRTEGATAIVDWKTSVRRWPADQ